MLHLLLLQVAELDHSGLAPKSWRDAVVDSEMMRFVIDQIKEDERHSVCPIFQTHSFLGKVGRFLAKMGGVQCWGQYYIHFR